MGRWCSAQVSARGRKLQLLAAKAEHLSSRERDRASCRIQTIQAQIPNKILTASRKQCSFLAPTLNTHPELCQRRGLDPTLMKCTTQNTTPNTSLRVLTRTGVHPQNGRTAFWGAACSFLQGRTAGGHGDALHGCECHGCLHQNTKRLVHKYGAQVEGSNGDP